MYGDNIHVRLHESVLKWIRGSLLNELCLRVTAHKDTLAEQIWKSIPWLNTQPLLFIHQLNKWASFSFFFAPIKPVCVRVYACVI